MEVNNYQSEAFKTAQYPLYAKVLYPTLGLLGEAGELVAKLYDALWPYGEPVPDGQEQFKEAFQAVIGVAQRCEVLKKQVRGGTIDLTDDQKAAIRSRVFDRAIISDKVESVVGEAMDVNWYICALLTDLNTSYESALKANLQKLSARQQKGQIHNHQPDSQDHK